MSPHGRPAPDPRLAAALRPQLAAGRRRGRGRGDGAHRAEEPRLRGDRRGPARERPLRRGGGRDHLRALLHVAAHLHRAELVAGRRRGRGGARRRASAASRRRSSSRRSRSSPGSCSCCSRCFRLGWIAQFLSKAVVTGFLAGAAVDVVIGELPEADRNLVGRRQRVARARLVDARARRHPLDDAARRRRRARGDPRPALRRARRSPARSCSSSAGSRLVRCSTSARTGSRSSATCRAGCRRPSCPGWDLVAGPHRDDLVAALALLLIGFSQTAGDARAFATRHRYRIDVNQESVAQGMANVGAGVFQGMPVSTSLSASSLNESAGARTPVASLVTGGLVLRRSSCSRRVFSGCRRRCSAR